MNNNLKCFISAPYEADTEVLKNLLAENDVDFFDVYDFSIGESMQQILKRKIRQADFAIFVLSKDSPNVLYEMGVCEGIGKQHFILLEKDFRIPIYIENKLFIRANLRDREFLKLTIEKILKDVKDKNIKPSPKHKDNPKQVSVYDENIKEILRSYLPQIKNLREIGTERELEFIVGDIFKTIKSTYVENSISVNKGVDFAIWNDQLGKIVGNPIIVELKYGNLSPSLFKSAEEQLKSYAHKTEAKVAILLYLDKANKRYSIGSTLSPIVLSYDIEDFTNALINSSFETIILNQRNKIAHGIK